MRIEKCFFSTLPCYEDRSEKLISYCALDIYIYRISLKLELWFKSYRVQTDTQTNFLQNVPGIVNFTLFGQQNTPVLACLYIMGVNLSTRILLSSLCISAKSHISQEEKWYDEWMKNWHPIRISTGSAVYLVCRYYLSTYILSMAVYTAQQCGALLTR